MCTSERSTNFVQVKKSHVLWLSNKLSKKLVLKQRFTKLRPYVANSASCDSNTTLFKFFSFLLYFILYYNIYPCKLQCREVIKLWSSDATHSMGSYAKSHLSIRKCLWCYPNLCSEISGSENQERQNHVKTLSQCSLPVYHNNNDFCKYRV